MRRLGKILLIVLAIVVVLVLALGAYVQLTWDRPADRPIPTMTAPRDSATVARGEYLYKFGHMCWSCHAHGTPDANSPPSGGMKFDLREVGPGFGIYYAPNITPDSETGIGSWSDGEIVQALREGIGSERHVLFPIMPTDWLKGMSDEDALAIAAYLKSIPPVRDEVPKHEYSFFAKALFAFGILKPQPAITQPVVGPEPGITPEYGEYLARNASGCADCHTPRNLQTGEVFFDSLFAGSSISFGEAEAHPLQSYARNITPDAETGIGAWSEDQFLLGMRTGLRPDGTVLDPHMPYAYYGLWNESDLRAIFQFLKTVPPVRRTVPAPWYTKAVDSRSAEERGRLLFEARCQACHGPAGTGAVPTNVQLAEVSTSLEDAVLIEFINDGIPDLRMPGFKKTLTPEQLADIVAYIRSWQQGESDSPARQ